jgi:ceramide glucosyltransferase
MSWAEWLLVLWSGAAAGWWLLAIWLVRGHPAAAAPPRPGRTSSLTVFKPLPPETTAAERAALAAAVQSFVTQLGAEDELLVGVPEKDAAHWAPFVADWSRQTDKRVRVCPLPTATSRANPKIARLEWLAPAARGKLWLWSDADIVAPPQLLAHLEHTLAQSGAGAVTCPYCIRRVAGAPAVLDAAFVNAEFLPGALLLGRRGAVNFAFGAATIFRAADFRAKVAWDALGAALADDYALGQQLQPVALAGPMVETLALETTASGALRHYYRWQKTIRWCRPGSYAALLSILPLPGWAAFASLQPSDRFAWVGLAAQWAIELAAVAALCLAVGCRMPPRAWLALALWPPVRALTWLAAWLPIPVGWRGAAQRWSRPSRQRRESDLPRVGA